MAANGIFSLAHDSVEPAKMLFGDVGVVYGQSVTYTCDPGLEETEVDREKAYGNIDECFCSGPCTSRGESCG